MSEGKWNKRDKCVEANETKGGMSESKWNQRGMNDGKWNERAKCVKVNGTLKGGMSEGKFIELKKAMIERKWK